MEQRFQQDEKRCVDLKRQNEEDTKLLNDLNTQQAAYKLSVRGQVENWEAGLENAKSKFDATKAKVDSNRTTIDDLIKAIINTGGDRFIGPEGERPKKEVPEKEKPQGKIWELFGL